MAVAFDESGNRELTVKPNDFGRVANVAADFRIRADGRSFASATATSSPARPSVSRSCVAVPRAAH